jgi:hypothetical protein
VLVTTPPTSTGRGLLILADAAADAHAHVTILEKRMQARTTRCS